MICHKSRSISSLQHLHSIEFGIIMQCQDLYKWIFQSFEVQIIFSITEQKIIFDNIRIATFKTTITIYFRGKVSHPLAISIASCVSMFSKLFAISLYMNFYDFWFMPFCFMMKKNHFKQKLLLWPQFPFKNLLTHQETLDISQGFIFGLENDKFCWA